MINKKLAKNTVISVFIFIIAVCVFKIITKADCKLQFINTYKIVNLPKLSNDMPLGGFSDLFYHDNHLIALTDRGPNTNIENLQGRDIRTFQLGTTYHPFLVEFDLNQDNAAVKKILNLPMTGIPIAADNDCSPFDKNKKEIPFDINGVDSESFIIDRFNNFWIGDEYYPSVLEFDKNLSLINRFAPEGSKIKTQGITYSLPEQFVNVRKNLGFEAIAYDGKDNIFIFSQGALKNEKNVKIIQFNIISKQVQTIYEYDIGNENNIISAAVFISSSEILTAERRNGEHQIRILKPKQYKINKSKLVLSLRGLNEINAHHKIEGIAFDGKDRVFIINDNDFGIDDENRKDSFIMEFRLKN